MDFLLVAVGFLFMIIGFLGSFLPVLPGPPLSWLGLLLLHLTDKVPNNWWFLAITLFFALLVFVLDFIIPAYGTKKFGGSKAGVIGTTLGLIAAIIFPVFGPFGIVIGPFLGALVGEMTNNVSSQHALKAAFGSFLGFLTGTFIKFVLCAIFFWFFISDFWTYFL